MAPAQCDELRLPAPTVEREGHLVAIWRPSSPARGLLRLEWRDGAGRLVERHRIPLDEAWPEVPVQLDLRRARVQVNRIEAWFQPEAGGTETHALAMFMARPAPGWQRYEVLYWQDLPSAGLAALPALGVTGTALRAGEMAQQTARQARAAAGLRWYGENLATDFYAAYHRWTSGRSVTWLFDRIKARYRMGAADAFQRNPPLASAAWLATVEARLENVARAYGPERPLFLNLADEAGIADLAAAWDFDLSPDTLTAWRAWLQEEWGTLMALNRDWNTAHAEWDSVMPALTDEALRSETALPAWMAFKAGMDALFVRAVQAGTDAVHRGNPQGLAGLEGGQIPGWGGYDYARLTRAVDLMEIYDIGNALSIARSLNPKLRILNTSFGSGAAERRQTWRLWLKGSDGLVVWDEDGSVIRPDGMTGPRGRELAPIWQELSGALGVLRLAMTPEHGKVAVLYSQPSFRLRWLLDRRAEAAMGAPHWTMRDAEAENAENSWHAAGRRAETLFAGLGAQPRWVTPAALLSGELERDGIRVLTLPHTIALSGAELAAIRRFAAGGGLVLADVPPGGHDTLGRARPAPPLADLGSRLRYPVGLLEDPAELAVRKVALQEMDGLLSEAGVTTALRVLDLDGRPMAGLEVRLWRTGDVVLAGILREAGGEGEVEAVLQLPAPAWLHSLRNGEAQIFTDRLRLRLGPVDPALVLLSPLLLPGPVVSGPKMALAGALVPFRFTLDGPTPAAFHPVQVTVTDPEGSRIPVFAETVRVLPEGVDWYLALTADAQAGLWHVQIQDVVSGQFAGASVEVH